ncbi:MAG: ABC-F family ATP-binding cassette domain-containing protein [Lachnospiraceae bacterium]|nr:ABC-F family ATP-binding cassette domain-containing protein [Lachnospiraceae bacterium]
MLLTCSHISKSFNEVPIIKDASFHLEDNTKLAIVGINGAGKSTLLKMIMGELEPDTGNVTLAKGKTMGYLAQQHAIDNSSTIIDELMNVRKDILEMERTIRELELQMKHASGNDLDELYRKYTNLTHQFELENGYAYKSEVTGILKGLGFLEDDFNREINQLSGGQKTRVALAKLLLRKPDLILLDEPTNHLDIHSIQFLENFLMNYKGGVILVSHDRYFLDRIVNQVIEIENSEVIHFTGNYSEFAKKKEQLRISQWNAYVNQQKMLKHQEEVIEKLKSFNREKSIKRAESREKMLSKIDVLQKPATIDDKMKIQLTPHTLSGKDVLTIRELSKSYDNLLLFQNANIDIKRGEHVALIGDNGTGKTTLFKIINELTKADSGEITLGSQVVIGYYDQEQQVLDDDNTLFEEISDAYPNLNNTEIRNTLAAFLFTNDDAFKLVKDLSGGEKGRLCLAKLMLSECNFLVLDEPTNHLDIVSKEILENAIRSYEGTIFYISHDRYFVNQTATRILELENGVFHQYLGNYDYYLEKKAEKEDAGNLIKDTTPQKQSSNALDWKASKEQQAAQRKKENELKKVEEEINQLENKISDLDDEMALPENACNSAKLAELSKEQSLLQEKLEKLYEKWEQLA